MLTIPPHKEDFEVRVMVERHVQGFPRKRQELMSLKLFSYEGYRVLSAEACLREFPWAQQEICSDVFIFEHSEQAEQYVLALVQGDMLPEDGGAAPLYSLHLYSFVDIDVKYLPRHRKLSEQRVSGHWDPPGGNLTSHQFVNNPAYRLRLPEACHLQLKAWTLHETSIQLMLIENTPDTVGLDLTELPF